MTISCKKLINKIKTGDLLHYCPVDMENDRHDVGVIYEIIETNIKQYKIFWSRSNIYDVYSEKTLERKLKQKCCGKNNILLISNNCA